MAGMTDSRSGAASFRAARDFLLRERDDYDAARAGFCWPELHEFNWALDWFDVIATEHPGRTALRIVTPARPRGGRGGPERRRGARHPDQLRRHVGPVQPGGQLAAGRGRPAGRPAAAHAGQHSPALGDHSGRDEARRGHHPDLDAARPAGPGRPDQPRAGPARDHRIGARAEVPRGARGLDPDRGRAHDRGRDRTRSGRPGGRGARRRRPGRPREGRGWLTRSPGTRARTSPRTAPPRPATRCCCTSRPARPPGPSWSSTRTRRTLRGICPRCTGSACSRATCT